VPVVQPAREHHVRSRQAVHAGGPEPAPVAHHGQDALAAAAPARPMVMASSGAAGGGGNVGKRMGRSGTGVFLPWTVGPKRYNKHLPPRIQKRRFSAMMSPIEAQG